MPGFTPGRRWQPPYSPFKKENFGDRALQVLEYSIKGPLFGCRMCGNCLLQETAFICPMECPKGLRNGPCGGSTSEYCYVDKTRPCIWYKIYERSFKLGREELLLEVLPPLDWEKVGQDSWRDIFKNVARIGIRKVASGLLARSRETRQATWDSIFRPVRQPDWWQGDSDYHPPGGTRPASDLERRLAAGEFVVTCEITPPLSANTERLVESIGKPKKVPFIAPKADSVAKLGDRLARGESEFVVIDLETTSMKPEIGSIVDVAALRVRDGQVVDRFESLVNPGRPIPQEAFEVHGISDDHVKDAPTFEAILPELLEALKGAIPLAYNAEFDRKQLLSELGRLPAPASPPPAFQKNAEWIDPLVWARELQKLEKSRALAEVAARLGAELS